MRFITGYDGWVRFELDDPYDLLVYVRMAPNTRGRQVIRELYVDTTETRDEIPLTGPEVAGLPLDLIEAVLNDPEEVAELERKRQMGFQVPLGVVASYFATHIGGSERARAKYGWLAEQRWTHHDDEGGRPLTRHDRSPRRDEWAPSDYLLEAAPVDGLTDDFLADVARAYAAAVERGESPNRAIAESVGAPLKTVQRWVYTARQRGIMPPGRKGAVG